LRTAELILRAFVLWLGSGSLIAQVVTWDALPLAVRGLLVVPLALVAGQGLHLLGIIAHDGSHSNLHRDRVTSFVIGILCSSAVPLHCDVGFAVTHAAHHHWLNTDRDPDIEVLTRFRSFLPRAFLTRSMATRNYLRRTIHLALGRLPDGQTPLMNLPVSKLSSLARLNLVCCVCWLALYAVLTWRWPSIAASVIWIPVAGAFLLSGVRPSVEHAGTAHGKYDSSRSYVHPVFTFLFAGTNYHLAHHLYPTVPCYRLPALHQWLQSAGYFEGQSLHVDRTLWRYLTYVTSRYPYPQPAPSGRARPVAEPVAEPEAVR
jgi:fatty acid desaturase